MRDKAFLPENDGQNNDVMQRERERDGPRHKNKYQPCAESSDRQSIVGCHLTRSLPFSIAYYRLELLFKYFQSQSLEYN